MSWTRGQSVLLLAAIGAALLLPRPAGAAETQPSTRPQFRHPDSFAKSIVFVCAGNRQMAPKFEIVKSQLLIAVGDLGPRQSFNVYMLHAAGARRLNPGGMVPATKENKQKAEKFLADLQFAETTDPIIGLSAAFAEKPQLMYLMTDGSFKDNDAVLKKVRELNKPVDGRAPVKVNTVAFVDENDKDTAFFDVLTKIAQESGGNFNHVTVKDLRPADDPPK